MKDLIGQRFGKLLVIAPVANRERPGAYICQCDCGKTVEHKGAVLKIVKSCGCGARKPFLVGDAASFRNLFAVYKGSAKKDQRSFELSEITFRELTSSNCFYCGVEPSKPYRRPRNKFSKTDSPVYLCNGIDRIDSAIGYTEDNCVSCCETCNYMKRSLPQDVFLSHVRAIVKHFSV